MKLFARRRAVPTPADLHTDSLRRVEAAVAPALTTPAAEPSPIVPERGSYKVTYKLRDRVTPEPITAVDVDAAELEAEIITDLVGILGTSKVRVVVDLGKKCGLIRAHGMTVGSFDLAPIGGAR